MPWYYFGLSATIVTYGAVALAIVHILRARRDPRGMLAWILALLLLPLLGLLLYLIVAAIFKTRFEHRQMT